MKSKPEANQKFAQYRISHAAAYTPKELAVMQVIHDGLSTIYEVGEAVWHTDFSFPAAGRCMGRLRKQGLMEKTRGAWVLTDRGEAVVSSIKK